MKTHLDIGSLTVSELDDLDLTSLTASELAAYGDRVGWTTEDLIRALELREAYNLSTKVLESNQTLLNDPVVKRAAKIVERHKSPTVTKTKVPTADWSGDDLKKARPSPASKDSFVVKLIKALLGTK